MLTLTATRRHAARRPSALGSRFLFWILALDAGYRSAHAFSRATDDQLADMGLTRADADAEFVRLGGADAAPRTSFGAW
jgi:uncharacterized protein YjiS (DUF1127 family)